MMEKLQYHIASKIAWETVFYDKAKAPELLGSLSNWSHFKLSKHLADTFQAICPDDETWQIDQLVLDIGPIQYNTLGSDLNKKVPNALKEALAILLFKTNQNQSTSLQILSEEDKTLRVLEVFLLQGHYPWNASIQHQKTFSKLMESALQHHEKRTVVLLKRLGKLPRVRKRLSWQLEDHTIKLAIKSLEPEDHGFIASFVEAMSEAPKRSNEMVVPYVPFRKSVWLWVFDYLFVDRGTFFNKVDFVKHNLAKVSQHFNLKYELILNWVDESLRKVSKDLSNRDPILAVLNTILESHRAGMPSKPKMTTLESQLQLLEHWLSDNFQDVAAAKLNTLLKSLSQKSPAALRQFLINHHWNAKQWQSFVYKLHLSALTSVVKIIAKEQTAIFLQAMHWINQAQGEKRVARKVLWGLFLEFLISPQQPQKNYGSFIGFSLKKLAQVTSQSPETVLSNLIFKVTEVRPKNRFVLNAMPGLVHQAGNRLKNTNSNELQKRLKKLLDALAAVRSFNGDVAAFKALEFQFLMVSQWYPNAIFSALRQHPNRAFVQQLVSLVMDEESAATVLKQMMGAFYDQLRSLEKILKDEAGILGTDDTLKKAMKQIYRTGLLQLLHAPDALVLFLIRDWWHEFKKGITSKRIVDALTLYLKEDLSLYVDVPRVNPQSSTWILSKKDLMDRLKHPESFRDTFSLNLKEWDRNAFLEVFDSLEGDAQNRLIDVLFPQASMRYKKFMEKARGALKNYNLQELIHLKRWLLLMFWNTLETVMDENRSSSFLWAALEKALQLRFEIPEPKGDSMGVKVPFKTIYEDVTFNPALVLEYLQNAGELEGLVDDFQKRHSFHWFCMGMASVYTVEKKSYFLWFSAISEEIHKIKDNSEKERLTALHWTGFLQMLRLGKPEQAFLENHRDTLLKGVAKDAHRRNLQAKMRSRDKIVLAEPSEFLKEISAKGQAEYLLYDWLTGSINRPVPINRNEQLGTLAHFYPMVLYRLLKRRLITRNQRKKAFEVLGFDGLVDGISQLHPEQKQKLNGLVSLLQAVCNDSEDKNLNKKITECAGLQLIDRWMEDGWGSWTAKGFLKEVFWELQMGSLHSKKDVSRLFKQIEIRWPTKELKLLAGTAENDLSQRSIVLPEGDKTVSRAPIQMETPKTEDQIPVVNAGLVLLNSYFPMLFERLKLTSGTRFSSVENQLKAVHYLQYLATGLDLFGDEAYLVLNKVLCGLQIQEPVTTNISMTENEKVLMDGLIDAAMGYWPSIGNSSRKGFRGNWIMRNGLLNETANRWTLTVEKKAYDLLIQKSPFSFSIIKFPWMEKPLHIDWPY